jgi:hypothetical protein
MLQLKCEIPALYKILILHFAWSFIKKNKGVL